MMIIHDDHLWWSYIVIMYDDHIWWSSGSHLGVIWGSSGRHLGVIWDPFGIHLETSGRMEAEEASGGQISYYVPHSRTECKSSINISILRCVFDGTINYGCIFTARSAGRQRHGSRTPCKAPLPRPWEPLQLKTVWGILYIYIYIYICIIIHWYVILPAKDMEYMIYIFFTDTA